MIVFAQFEVVFQGAAAWRVMNKLEAAIEACRATPFQKRVYRATCLIPAGRVSTYALLARAVGCGAARAVGQALKQNPLAPAVPCHRVIGSDLAIGGFQGETGGAAIARKIRLLRLEGVVFEAGVLKEPWRVVAPDCKAPAL